MKSPEMGEVTPREVFERKRDIAENMRDSKSAEQSLSGEVVSLAEQQAQNLRSVEAFTQEKLVFLRFREWNGGWEAVMKLGKYLRSLDRATCEKAARSLKALVYKQNEEYAPVDPRDMHGLSLILGKGHLASKNLVVLEDALKIWPETAVGTHSGPGWGDHG